MLWYHLHMLAGKLLWLAIAAIIVWMARFADKKTVKKCIGWFIVASLVVGFVSGHFMSKDESWKKYKHHKYQDVEAEEVTEEATES